VSFLVAGRDKNAPKFSHAILTQLRDTAASLGLKDKESWRSPFGMGFIFRHALLGLEKAKMEHWSGLMQRGYPTDALVKANFLDAVPAVFGMDRRWLQDEYDAWVSLMGDPRSDFVQGVVWADRVWHSYQRDIKLNDPVGLEVRALEKRYQAAYGTMIGNAVGFRLPGRYYRFLLASTLAPKAFHKTFSDSELTQVLNKKTK